MEFGEIYAIKLWRGVGGELRVVEANTGRAISSTCVLCPRYSPLLSPAPSMLPRAPSLLSLTKSGSFFQMKTAIPDFKSKVNMILYNVTPKLRIKNFLSRSGKGAVKEQRGAAKKQEGVAREQRE